jgi:hypothetical protein
VSYFAQDDTFLGGEAEERHSNRNQQEQKQIRRFFAALRMTALDFAPMGKTRGSEFSAFF